jgi:parvulin-like peptidyl-prolyl isomerase
VDKVILDTTQLKAEYKATIAEYKEPTKVHAREITASSLTRAEQLRNWAVNGRLPVLIQGRALLLQFPKTESDSDLAAAMHMNALSAELSSTANTDSLLGEYALAGAPVALPGRPMVSVGNKSVPDLAQKTNLTGPFLKTGTYGFGFNDLSKQDKLYYPELVRVQRLTQLDSLLGRPARPESATVAPTDSAKLGVYVKLEKALSASFVPGLFTESEKTASALFDDSTAEMLRYRVTRKDTAQKATFQDIAKRFSKSPSRWSGGDLYWLTRDDKAHDEKLVKAAFNLSKGSISPVIKLNDSSYAFVTMDEKKAALTRPFSEVSGKIETRLRREQEKAVSDQLLKDLRAKANVEIVMKEADFVVEPAPEEAQPTEPVEQK